MEGKIVNALNVLNTSLKNQQYKDVFLETKNKIYMREALNTILNIRCQEQLNFTQIKKFSMILRKTLSRPK